MKEAGAGEGGGRKTPTMLVAMSLGFFSACSQIILLREILNFGRGNELSIASALFFWLVGIGTGAWSFARAAAGKRSEPWLFFLGLACVLLCVGCACFCRVFGAIISIDVGEAVNLRHLMLCSAAAMLPAGITIGTLFPLLVRAGRKSLTGSFLYMLEAAGSATGGLVFTFLLAGRLGHLAILACSSIPFLASLAFLADRQAAGRRAPRVAAWAAALVMGAGLLAGSKTLDAMTQAVRWRYVSGTMELRQTLETKHQRLDLGYENGQFAIFSDGNFDFSFPDPYDAGMLADVVLLEHPAPRRVLAIGPSPLDAARRAEAHGVKRFDYVHIDPAVMQLVQSSQPWLAGRSFCPACIGRFVPDDGRRFVRLARPWSYDIVWVDLADPMTLLVNRYYTIEFYRQVVRALAPGGVFVTGFFLDYSAPQKASKKYSASILKTVASVFRKTLLGFSGKVLVFASGPGGAVTDDPDVLAGRAASRNLDPAAYPPEVFENYFDPHKSAWLAGMLGKERVVLNTDMHPVSYRLQLEYFVQLTGSSIERLKATAEEILLRKTWQIPWWAALLPALLFFIVLHAAKKRHPSAAMVYAMALTGGSGIVLQIVLLLAYQTFSGIMYEGIGLLYGAFMIGLAVGTAAGERLRLGARTCEIVVIANAAAVALILPAGIQPLVVIPVLVATSGFSTGFAFPLLYAAHRRIRESQRREGLIMSAGIIDGADHMGAAAGAILCALVLIPSFGLTSTIVLVVAYKLSSLLLLALASPA
jgi:spermidine synthase